jgi:hypothetical protein
LFPFSQVMSLSPTFPFALTLSQLLTATCICTQQWQEQEQEQREWCHPDWSVLTLVGIWVTLRGGETRGFQYAIEHWLYGAFTVTATGSQQRVGGPCLQIIMGYP